ncbi:alpha/beta fold hydrolase [Rhodococcus sp. AG1013]|uniref:alpha/beta fold hydrolase n=1 Tax=unclassified Rhodococcus (in: high G+C Gram-positive bacteria) TaxID=192944 RepID=UPI000E0B9429|nr:alpha/beta fold hydrolase [Rhodococcus sp. AG1013]RDI35772.1 polyhydroxyalkanoate synthase [Rhodococcus sp. AG1013]
MRESGWETRLNVSLRNAWGLTFGDGVGSSERTPSELIHQEPHRDLHRYGPVDSGAPVLLVPPLAVPMHCYDLRPGQSLAAHLLGSGRTPYVVDYGTMGYADRNLGFEDWTDDIVPGAVRRVSELHGGAPVDVVGWSLGGTLALLTASAHPDLPIASVTALGTPIDYSKIPTMAVARAVARVTGHRPVTELTRLMGGLPAPLVQVAYRATAPSRELLKPWFVARNLHETETLARMEAIDRFMAEMPGYPARLFYQMAEELVLGNGLLEGRVTVGGTTIKLAELAVPVLAVGGTGDVIATADSVGAIVDVLTGSPSVRFETAPGSHLGLLAGPGARDTTWRHIDAFLGERPAG